MYEPGGVGNSPPFLLTPQLSSLCAASATPPGDMCLLPETLLPVFGSTSCGRNEKGSLARGATFLKIVSYEVMLPFIFVKLCQRS